MKRAILTIFIGVLFVASGRDLYSTPIVDPVILSKAQAILSKLNANPLDDVAQGEARAAIVECKDKKTVSEMFSCTGFLVPPVVRLNCLNRGSCMPLSWDPNGMPSGHAEWWDWLKYDDQAQMEIAAYAPPWVTTPENAKRCGKESQLIDGTIDQHRFTDCMVKDMGGRHVVKARSCYLRNNASPLYFGACLSDVQLSRKASHVVECVTHTGSPADCSKSLPEKTKVVLQCIAAAGTDATKASACARALPPDIRSAVICAVSMGSDASLFGHCLKGAGIVAANKLVDKAGGCVDGVMAAKAKDDSITGTKFQSMLLQCAVKQGAGEDLITIYTKGQALVECVNAKHDDLIAQGECLKKAGVSIPREAEIATCVAKAPEDALNAVQCAGIKGADQVELARRCMDGAKGDSTKAAICLGVRANLTPEQQRLVQCASKSDSIAAGAACMAKPYASPEVALAIECAASSNGNSAGMAVCMAGPKMNAELRIAAECLASSGGEPVSFAGCAGGRLTMKELQQCVAGGWNAKNGCFGENNEVVKYFAAQEKTIRGVLKAAGLEQAYDNVLGDLKKGQLGQGNDLRKTLTVINQMALVEPTQAAENIAKEVGHVAPELTAEINKAKDQLQAQLQNAAPAIVPSATVGPDKVTVALPGASATVGSKGASVDVGDVHVSIGW